MGNDPWAMKGTKDWESDVPYKSNGIIRQQHKMAVTASLLFGDGIRTMEAVHLYGRKWCMNCGKNSWKMSKKKEFLSVAEENTEFN
ncbi:hypothetical protein CEXT_355361 [Caerostris extrusa]|uniref:Uncharacterized protein n=1 Tax=Caerostris extrusa TaxID=172846 RepID=A0AAV4XMT8_CAEEX|nr:hypothetical protein CEXT_355361 [Caerostris extrusa]